MSKSIIPPRTEKDFLEARRVRLEGKNQKAQDEDPDSLLLHLSNSSPRKESVPSLWDPRPGDT